MPKRRSSATVDEPHFKQEQRGVAVSMAAGFVASLVALGIAAMSSRNALAAPFADRLQGTLRADGVIILCFAASIANVARLRFCSAEDIGGSAATGGSDRVRQAGAVAQNTLEQAFLAIATHGAVTAMFVRSHAVVATMVGLFVVGRLLFWAGYERGAKGRALGFALTFYPSVLALVASVGVMLAGLLSSG